MKLHPIHKELESNTEFATNPYCQDTLYANLDFYKKVGFNPPWISYYARIGGELVGTCAYKGKPVNNIIEIAYGTFEHWRQKGIATKMCKALIDLALATDDSVKITAHLA
jgi:ribosomal-protein-alanine N-acetyltransferase